MHSTGANRRTKGRWNIPDVGPRFGSTKLAAAAIRGALTLAVLSALLLIAARPAQAQTETVLYNFCSQPDCSDGGGPVAGLILDAQGNLYGTAERGGATSKTCPSGCGTVFEVTPGGTEKVLHSFSGKEDGHVPQAGLVRDASGNLYGTTLIGGTSKRGTAFKVAPNGTETVLYSFGGASGAFPSSGLVFDGQGNLYGTTSKGGHAAGEVFKIAPDGTETVLFAFIPGQGDGKFPYGGVVLDAQGNLYGTTAYGYGTGGHGYCRGGCGTVFALSPTGVETILYNFKGIKHNDGSYPNGVVRDAQGNLFGTTAYGGAGDEGTVFKVTPDGTETVLHSFAGGTDGAHPVAGLVLDAQGNLYGTAASGGDLSCGSGGGCGVVFEVTPAGAEKILHTFTGGMDGAYPYAGLVFDSQGNLYGTTVLGGSSGGGVVFEVTP